MSSEPKWIADAESTCIQEWTDFLHAEAKRLFIQDGTHGSMLFCFDKENGLVSVNPIPPKTDQHQLNNGVMHAINDYNLYGAVFIGEVWMYLAKDKDHTVFQLLDGEMNVSDLNDEDKKEALMIRMENQEGGCVIYLDEIKRDENGHRLNESKKIQGAQRKWFIEQNHNSY